MSFPSPSTGDQPASASPRTTVHLISNAHLDPVWMWEWEEGAAAAISTFRTAADLCEEFDGFIFNHNEVILYRWVEEFEPALFERIQRLVRAGKWHIMGGWYLQPDCNLPSGESFVRQILLGRQYFKEKFGVVPTTALNLDPFGHTRGLVQIIAKSGFDSYLFCRPDPGNCQLASDTFIWEGYDGSRLLGQRVLGGYNSPLGGARAKVEHFLAAGSAAPAAIVLWGVGDHGGGPSHQDLSDLADLIRSRSDVTICHSTPEAYFASIKPRLADLPVHRKDLNPWGVGCYTSMIRIKQRHRLLENELYASEKMAAAAWARGLLAYPRPELHSASIDLATCQFHDTLPGSSIQLAEEMGLRLLDHGLETLSRLKARAFFALAQGQPRAKDGEIPILVYNPHPYPVRAIIECEFMIFDQNWTDSQTLVSVYQGDQPLPAQVEKELSNVNLDWRKRAVFAAELAPAQMNRFDCRLEQVTASPALALQPQDGAIHFQTPELDVLINSQTGLLDRYRVGGVDYLAPNACCPLVMLDSPDPWGMLVSSFRNSLGVFNLLSPQENQRFSGVVGPLPAVRVIEDGPVRSVVEAVLGYGDSRACLRYKLPKQGSEIEVELRVLWNEKDRMLKLSLPGSDKTTYCLGQVAYGAEILPADGKEAVAQKWVAVVSQANNTALTVINDGTYGLDFSYGELRLSLLRSPAYSAHPIFQRPIVPPDRFSPRMDQGERLFRFWLNAGPSAARLEQIDREALAHNEKPMALSFFPEGGASQPSPFITLSDPAVQLAALKQSESGADLILRLFEPTGQPRVTTVRLPDLGLEQEVSLGGFEIGTYRVDLPTGSWTEIDLVEGI